MISIDHVPIVGPARFEAALRWSDHAFIGAPATSSRAYAPQWLEWSFRQVWESVRELAARYAAAGYGSRHRVGLLLEHWPKHLLHKMAMNPAGVCCVPTMTERPSVQLSGNANRLNRDTTTSLCIARAA